jgi:hypothetical protein
MNDSQLIDSPRERPALTFVQFANDQLGTRSRPLARFARFMDVRRIGVAKPETNLVQRNCLLNPAQFPEITNPGRAEPPRAIQCS